MIMYDGGRRVWKVYMWEVCVCVFMLPCYDHRLSMAWARPSDDRHLSMSSRPWETVINSGVQCGAVSISGICCVILASILRLL